jgi:hypothetical protein
MKKNKKEKVSSSSTDKMFLEQPVEMTNPMNLKKIWLKVKEKFYLRKKDLLLGTKLCFHGV